MKSEEEGCVLFVNIAFSRCPSERQVQYLNVFFRFYVKSVMVINNQPKEA